MDEEIEDAVQEFVEQINEHRFAGSGVPQQASVDFYMGIADACRMHANVIKEEMGD